jgi:hypothetical protein
MPLDPNELDVPTSKAYKRSILALRPIHDSHLEILKTHFLAPAHTITATELATAVGYKNYNAVNLQYGTFADRLCQSLGKIPDTRLSILVTFEKDGFDREEHWKLVMRPEVVQALTELGWFFKRVQKS